MKTQGKAVKNAKDRLWKTQGRLWKRKERQWRRMERQGKTQGQDRQWKAQRTGLHGCRVVSSHIMIPKEYTENTHRQPLF